MKLEVLVANEEALKVLVETKFDDAQLVWDLADAFDDVEKAITKFQKKRDDFVKEHGTPDPNNPERFQMSNPEAFTEEVRKLLEVEVDIVFPLIPFTELKKIKPTVKQVRAWKALGLVASPKKVEEPDVNEVEKPEDVEVVEAENLQPKED